MKKKHYLFLSYSGSFRNESFLTSLVVNYLLRSVFMSFLHISFERKNSGEGKNLSGLFLLVYAIFTSSS